MRVLLSIGYDWRVNCPALGLSVRQLTAVESTDGDTVPVLDLNQHAGEAVSDLTRAGADAIAATYDRLTGRQITPGDPEKFGRYLFDCVLGSNWGPVQQHVLTTNDWFLEIALAWDQQNDTLSRLPWELMCGPDGYLSNGYLRNSRRVDVAITRVVLGASAKTRQVEALPRVLFVVGTSLNDASVRPAAEILCMLKRTREQYRRMHGRMLERASPSQLKAAVESFKPDAIHFLCHGGINKDGPYLQLQSETGKGEEAFSAKQIAGALTGSGDIAPMVLLSACQTGTTGPTMQGPAIVAPFAAQLVHAGIPVVIGMSGKVSDLACRLFTRRFSESLMGSDRLIVATGEGRRAAFTEGKPPEGSIDWAYPAVFLSENVDPDFAPVDPGAPADETDTRIRVYSVRSAPTFCGRYNFFQEFERLVQPGGPAVLAAYTANPAPGYGRKRLLEELAVQAILEGHIPVLVTSRTRSGGEPPRTAIALALEIDRAVDTASRAFKVKLAPFSPAKKLQEFADRNFPDAQRDAFDEEMRAALVGNQGKIPDEAALLAIQQRLTELIGKIRQASEERVRAAAAAAEAKPSDQALARLARLAAADQTVMKHARAVVLLDSVESFDAALKALLAHPSLSDTGLGNSENPAPLVVTFSLNNTARAVLDDMVQNQTAYPNWRFAQLKPFDVGGENLLAYARILLNPFDPKLVPNVSDRAWFIDDSVSDDIRNAHVENFNTLLKGLPSELSTAMFFAIAKFASNPMQGFLKPAVDDQWVAELENERKRNSGGGP